MAGNSVIGALRVNLSADTAAFETGLKKAKSQLSTFGSQIKTAMAGLSIAITAGLTAASVAIRGAINEADELGKAAQKFGVPIEQLSKLKYAAELSDVSLEQLGTGFRKLSQNMQLVAAGRGKEAAEAFRALGISVTDANGKLKSSEEVFNEVAQRFSELNDGAGKTALAMAIFGRSGADLIPLLNAGADGIRQMTDEAKALGLEINDRTARAAETFNDNLTRLKSVMEGVVTQVTAALAPVLADLTDRLVEIARNGDLAGKVVESFGFVMQQASFFTAHANAALAEFTRWGQAIGEVTTALSNADFAAAGNALIRARDDVSRITSDLEARLEAIRNNYGSNISAKGDRLDISAGKQDAPLLAARQQVKSLKDEIGKPLDISPLRSQLRQFGTEAKSVFDGIGKTIAGGIGGAIQGLIAGTYEWADALQTLNSILSRIASKFIESGIDALFAGFFSGGSGGGTSPLSLGYDPSMFKAAGGPVRSGRGYIVGENGPEFFSPSSNGTIIPNDAMWGGGSQVIIENHGADIERRQEKRNGVDIERLIVRVVNDTISSGQADRSLAGRFAMRPQTGRR